jgi:glutamate/aspartate transport system substrate-binding protein
MPGLIVQFFEGNSMLRLVSLGLAVLFATAAVAQTDIPGNSRLKTIAAKKTVRIAYRTEAVPFSYAGEDDQPVGYTVELCKLVAESLKQQLRLTELTVRWVPVNFESRFSAVETGKADMECGATTVTLSRMRQVEFSSVVFIASTGVVTRDTSTIRSIADMRGRKIAVIAGTSNENALRDHIEERKLDITVVPVKNRDEALAALEDGSVVGYAADKLLLIGAQAKDPANVVMLPDELSVDPYAIVLPRSDWALRVAVNSALAQIYRRGEGVALYKRWFDPVGLPLGLLMGAAFRLGSLAD